MHEKWPLPEINIFLEELMLHRPLMFHATTDSSERESLVFLCLAAQTSYSTLHLLVQKGLLNLIFEGSARLLRRNRRNELLDIANATLRMHIRLNEDDRRVVDEHPLSYLWPSEVPFFLRPPQSIDEQCHNRRITWQKLDYKSFQLRLLRIPLKIPENNSYELQGAELFDAIADLLVFSELSEHSQWFINEVEKTLRRYLESSEEARVVYKLCCDSLGRDPALLRYFPLPGEHILMNAYWVFELILPPCDISGSSSRIDDDETLYDHY